MEKLYIVSLDMDGSGADTESARQIIRDIMTEVELEN